MLDYNKLYEIEDNFSPEKPVTRKFRDQKVRKNSQPNYNNYRIITNELLD
jgi:hypothetical protein